LASATIQNCMNYTSVAVKSYSGVPAFILSTILIYVFSFPITYNTGRSEHWLCLLINAIFFLVLSGQLMFFWFFRHRIRRRSSCQQFLFAHGHHLLLIDIKARRFILQKYPLFLHLNKVTFCRLVNQIIVAFVWSGTSISDFSTCMKLKALPETSFWASSLVINIIGSAATRDTNFVVAEPP